MNAGKMTPKQKQKAQKSASQNKSYANVRNRLGEDLQEFATFMEALTAKKSSQKGGTPPKVSWTKSHLWVRTWQRISMLTILK